MTTASSARSAFESRIEVGDCREVLRRMIAEGVKAQMCVTSPPYYGLRDYGTAAWEGDDGSGCEHIAPPKGGTGIASAIQIMEKRKDFASGGQYRHTCAKCGARRVDKQIGLEGTIDCGKRGMFRFRPDLSDEQREYVVCRLIEFAESHDA